MKSTIVETKISDEKLRKLRNDIHDFEIITNQHAYLIMSSDTSNALAEVYMNYFPVLNKDIVKAKHPNGILGSFEGKKIFCDDDLEYGVVEIR